MLNNIWGVNVLNRKLIVIVALIAAALVIFVGYNALLSPEGVEGEKDVTIEIVNEETGLDESFNYTTNEEFLFPLMKEHEDELGLAYDSGDLGPMITTMGSYTADDSKQEYFHITVNGEDAVTGVQDIVLNDGDVYKFEIVNY